MQDEWAEFLKFHKFQKEKQFSIFVYLLLKLKSMIL